MITLSKWDPFESYSLINDLYRYTKFKLLLYKEKQLDKANTKTIPELTCYALREFSTVKKW